ncbi:MAG: glutamate-5-semialdehyde dehydrogenase [Culicoidibacterales bacterium]
MDYRQELIELALSARQAARELAVASTETKNAAIMAISDALITQQAEILAANEKDIQAGEKKGLTQALLDRLLLTPERIVAISQAAKEVVDLPDPIGSVIRGSKRPNGLQVNQVRVPLGVIGMIYEARPNVTVDAAILAIKSGNTCLLKGGSEAFETNMVLAQVIQGAIAPFIPKTAVNFIAHTDRAVVTALIQLHGYIDVVVPRGSQRLISAVVENATVPTIETGVGICHTFVDESADLTMALKIVENAKVQRPAVCNSLETILVHEGVARNFLPQLIENFSHHRVEIRGCERVQAMIDVNLATDEDWDTEYLDLIVSVKVVDTLDMAMQHIHEHGSHHSEAIITNDFANSQRFLTEVDAAAVYVNASTRFTDGGELGYGAELGISTQKLHARGPLGLSELTTNKYQIIGNGQIRS